MSDNQTLSPCCNAPIQTITLSSYPSIEKKICSKCVKECELKYTQSQLDEAVKKAKEKAIKESADIVKRMERTIVIKNSNNNEIVPIEVVQKMYETILYQIN